MFERITLYARVGGALASLVLMVACQSTNLPDMSGFIKKPQRAYYGLTSDSYGPRVVTQNPRTKLIAVRSCKSTMNDDPALSEWVRRGVSNVFSPVTDQLEPDESIKRQQMTEFFRIPADPVGGPVVAVIDRQPAAITFWHNSDLVPLDEVSRAAESYCARGKKTTLYVGSATKCHTANAPIVVNGQKTSTETFAISEFHCG